MKSLLLAAGLLIAGANLLASEAGATTLDTVRQRGVLACGVSTGFRGVERSKAKPLMAMTDTRRASNSCSVCRRSRVLRPHSDSSVTSTTSISHRCASASTLRRSVRFARAPEPVSRNTPTT